MKSKTKVIESIDNLSFQKMIEEELEFRSFGLLPDITAIVLQLNQYSSEMGSTQKTNEILGDLANLEQNYIEEKKYMKKMLEILFGFRNTSAKLMGSLVRKKTLNNVIDDLSARFGCFKTELVLLRLLEKDEIIDTDKEIYQVDVKDKPKTYEVVLRYSGEKSPYTKKDITTLRNAGVLKSTLAYCANERRVRIISTANEEKFPEQAKKLGAGSHLTMPLYLEGELFAYIHSSKKWGEPSFTNDNGFFYELIGNSIALALRNNSLYEKVRELSLKDPLTRAYNRRTLNDLLKKEISRVDRANAANKRTKENSFSIVMLDIDYFKKINDTYGHIIGDYVLEDFAKLLIDQSRNIDSLVRYGGEEFLSILPMTNATGAKKFAQKIQKTLKEKEFFGERYEKAGLKKPIRIASSVGIAVFDKNRYDSDIDLLKAADKALYYSKDHGRDKITLAKD